ncbi:unnamed protein product [Paramecium octaurelia]|uniref:Uncharacterized protein n=1 Tax=Paramecium octaurelia TaxID=43137 RepID=A0A8S1VNH2_PAROT|nr:unnamed protein product [Paramecium octaurelia]
MLGHTQSSCIKISKQHQERKYRNRGTRFTSVLGQQVDYSQAFNTSYRICSTLPKLSGQAGNITFIWSLLQLNIQTIGGKSTHTIQKLIKNESCISAVGLTNSKLFENDFAVQDSQLLILKHHRIRYNASKQRYQLNVKQTYNTSYTHCFRKIHQQVIQENMRDLEIYSESQDIKETKLQILQFPLLYDISYLTTVIRKQMSRGTRQKNLFNLRALAYLQNKLSIICDDLSVVSKRATINMCKFKIMKAKVSAEHKQQRRYFEAVNFSWKYRFLVRQNGKLQQQQQFIVLIINSYQMMLLVGYHNYQGM